MTDLIRAIIGLVSIIFELEPSLPEFIYLIHPFREGFFKEPTEEEESLLSQHFEYLKSNLHDGKVILAGPCLDQTFGLVVFYAEDEKSARDFMMNDPTVKNDLMVAELHPFKISLVRTDQETSLF